MPHDAIGACITGLLRSALHPAVSDSFAYIKVPPRQGFIVWCWRILWSTGGAGGAPEAANVTRRCEAIKAAADRNALAAEWQRASLACKDAEWSVVALR